MSICMVVIESSHDNVVDCWRGAPRNRPYTCSTAFTEVVHLKLPATDDGVASAIELMDPFQVEFLWCGKWAHPIPLHEVCDYLPEVPQAA